MNRRHSGEVNSSCYSFHDLMQLLFRLCLIPWTVALQASLSVTIYQSLFNLMSISWWCLPSISSSVAPFSSYPQSVFCSIRLFSNVSNLGIRWPEYWNFSFSISPFYEYSGSISFRIEWIDGLAVRGSLKSLLQHHRSKASIPPRSAFFIVQLSHPYMTTGKTIALSRWTFVGKVVSAVYVGHNFSSKEQASFNFMVAVTSAVVLEPKIIKSVTVFIAPPSISHEVMGPDAMILVFWTLNFKPTFSLSSFTFHFHALEKAMATHSGVLAWRFPGMEEPSGLPSVGSHRVGHNWSDLAAEAAAPPWKKSYDHPRQHIKKQRHYFANKGPSSQGYGFSSGHVWMWELGYKESWVTKNWCFWSVMLEKTLESPLDCKEIQPVHPKGN